MPNGGSDCCGTCWFNAKNKGKAGYDHAKDPEPAFCTIRSLPLDDPVDPFYTYCGNHPRHRPERDPIPIGPVFINAERALWKASPDSEDIRQHLLALVSQIEEQPRPEYSGGLHTDEAVVWQLGEFRDSRAAEALRRIASFDPNAAEPGPFGRKRNTLVQLALAALDKIEHGPA